ncbi:putative colanic acid biosynthesis acetyltransferase [uncultured Sphaerotilus sp.]|uniref:putative colanic acid biosynthesis acetyltransferase n=1 Tax=uncultured Sphaerotilus sp. TaxID=474984 RepID=UPI0030CA4179
MKPIKIQAKSSGVPQNADSIATFAGAASFPFRHRLLRLAWKLTWALLASWTPPPLHRWRVCLINLFGGHVDPSCFIYASVRIWYPPNLNMARSATLGPDVDCYTMGQIEIGPYAVVSQRTFLCTGTHDIHNANFQIGSRPIKIGANAWIAAEAFVGPGVIIGEGAVLGARGAAFCDLDAWTVYQGNPATAKSTRTRFNRTQEQ